MEKKARVCQKPNSEKAKKPSGGAFFKKCKNRVPEILFCTGMAIMTAGGAIWLHRNCPFSTKEKNESALVQKNNQSPRGMSCEFTPALTYSYVENQLYLASGGEIEFGGEIPRSLIEEILGSEKVLDLEKIGGTIRHIGGVKDEAWANLFKLLDENKKLRIAFLDNPELFQKIIDNSFKYRIVGAFDALENPKVVELLLQYPQEFVEIVKASSYYFDDNFEVLIHPRINELFREYTSEFVEIARISGRSGTPTSFKALGTPPIEKLFRDDPRFVIEAFGKIFNEIKWGKEITSALCKKESGEFFVEHPQEFMEIAKSTRGHTKEVFEVLWDPKVKKLFEQKPTWLGTTLGEIAHSTGNAYPREVLRVLCRPDVWKMFKQYPSEFVEIVKAAGRNAAEAIELLGKPGIKNLFRNHTSEFVEIAKVARYNTPEAFRALLNPHLKRFFVGSPGELVDLFRKIGSASGKYGPSAIPFEVLAKPEVGKLFLGHTEEFMEIVKATKGGGKVSAKKEPMREVFRLLATQKVKELFLRHKSEFMEIVKAAEGDAADAIELLAEPEMRGLFLGHKSEFVEIAKGTKAFTSETFELLARPEMKRLFLRNKSEFVEIAKVRGKRSFRCAYDLYSVFRLLATPEIKGLFLGNETELVEIVKAAKGDAADAIKALAEPEMKGLFLGHKSEFVEIARAVRGNANHVFKLLVDPQIKKLFIENPEKVVKNFVKIANADPKKLYLSLCVPLNDEWFKQMFVKYPDKLGEIATASRLGVEDAFYALHSSPKIRKLFEKHPNAFVELAKAAEHNAADAFKVLERPEIEKLFVEHPELFEIAKAAGKGTGHLLMALEKPEFRKFLSQEPQNSMEVIAKINTLCGRKSAEFFSLFSSEDVLEAFMRTPESFIALAEISGYAPVVYGLERYHKRREFVLENLESIPMYSLVHMFGNKALLAHKHNWKDGYKVAASLGAHADDREICINFAYAISTIGEENTRALYQKFGMEYFARYSEEVLRKLAQGNFGPERPFLFIVNNKEDHNHAFYQDIEETDFLAKHYNIVIAEVETEGEFYERLTQMAETYGKIETLQIGGHGSKGSIRLGVGPEERYSLTFEDIKELKEHRNLFSEKPTIVLASCSTGKNEGAIGAKISEAWNAELFAPKKSTYIIGYEIDEKTGKISEVFYGERSAVFDNGKEKQEETGSVPHKILNRLEKLIRG